MAQIREKALKDGTTSYEVRIKRAGYKHFSRSFRSYDEAIKFERDVESKIDRRENVAPNFEKTTVGDVFSAYIEKYKSEIAKQELYRIQRLNFDLGDRRVLSLKNEEIENYVIDLKKRSVSKQDRKQYARYYDGKERENRTYAASTVRKFIYTLKKVLQWHATKNNYKLSSDLFTGIGTPAAWENERDRRLPREEESALYEAASKGYKYEKEWVYLIGFALETAMRAQELLKARWSDLNIEEPSLSIPKQHVKTKTARKVPLSKRAVEIMKAMKEGHKKDGETRIFWMWSNSVILAAAFKRLTHRAKLLDLKFHDLRHEAISRLFEKNRLSDMQIAKISGHTDPRTLMRYYKLRPSNVAELLD